MVKHITAPKIEPSAVALAVLAGLADGAHEVRADDVSRYFKSLLNGPVQNLRIPAAAS